MTKSPSDADGTALTFIYRNWRGEVSRRRVLPIHVYFGATDWHPEPQWLMEAMDLDKGEARAFAMKDMQFGATEVPAGAAVGATALLARQTEILKAASRLVAGAFRRDGEVLDEERRPRFSIPARPDRDDDCVVVEWIRQASTAVADLSARQATNDWRPIAEAPTDGSRVDLYAHPYTGKDLRLIDCWWNSQTGWRDGTTLHLDRLYRVTHFRLPPPRPNEGERLRKTSTPATGQPPVGTGDADLHLDIDALKQAARALAIARNFNPDTLCEHWAYENWPTDKTELRRTYDGRQIELKMHYLWRRYVPHAEAAIRAYLIQRAGPQEAGDD